MSKYTYRCYYYNNYDFAFTFFTYVYLFFTLLGSTPIEIKPDTPPGFIAFSTFLNTNYPYLRAGAIAMLPIHYLIVLFSNPWRIFSSLFLLVPRFIMVPLSILSPIITIMASIAGLSLAASGAKQLKQASHMKGRPGASKLDLLSSGSSDLKGAAFAGGIAALSGSASNSILGTIRLRTRSRNRHKVPSCNQCGAKLIYRTFPESNNMAISSVVCRRYPKCNTRKDVKIHHLSSRKEYIYLFSALLLGPTGIHLMYVGYIGKGILRFVLFLFVIIPLTLFPDIYKEILQPTTFQRYIPLGLFYIWGIINMASIKTDSLDCPLSCDSAHKVFLEDIGDE